MKTSFNQTKVWGVTCSKCGKHLDTVGELEEEFFLTKTEAIEAAKNYDWEIKGDTATCDECK